jgi:hypothetical protein
MVKKVKVKRAIKFAFPSCYRGNLFWLIVFLILLLPLGLVLLLRNGYIVRGNSILYVRYAGKWGWLFFWSIFFFPVTLLLFIFKGTEVIEEETLSPPLEIN